MSISNYKRYVICPQCNNELVADGLMAHYRRAHKKELTAAEMAEILSHLTREPTRKPNRPKNLEKFRANLKSRQKMEIENKMKKWNKQTPFSMRQWGSDRPGRSGPLGPS